MNTLSRRSPVVINALVALWIVLTCNLTFFSRLHKLVPLDNWHGSTFLISAGLFLWAYTSLILHWLTWGLLARPLISLILCLSALTAFFVDTYGVSIDAGQIQNLMQTDLHEAMDLLSWHMLAYVLVVAGLPIFWLWRKPVEAPRIGTGLRHRLLASLISLALAVGIATCFYADYASIFRNQRPIRLVINPHNYVAGLRGYLRDLTELKHQPLLTYGADAHRLSQAGARHKPMLMVLVVGETARAESFGLNGYARNTSPELARHDIVNFSQVSSCGTATAISVPCMFSGMTRREYNASLASHREGLLDILQRAGYRVAWIDNNSGCKGTCARVSQQPLLPSRRAAWCQGGECQDDLLADTLEDFLAHAPVTDQVIVLHQLGSHGPAYYRRYPQAFRWYTPTCDSNQLQDCSRAAVINSYDNTIAYTDHVLARVIDILAKQGERYRTAFWYVSDHGESTGEHGLYLHGAPYLLAPDQQTHVPMVAWLSPDLRTSQPARTACITQRSAQPLSHDHLFHTLLGLLQVRTAIYNPTLDISTGCTA